MIACATRELNSPMLHYDGVGPVGRFVSPGCSAPPVIVGFEDHIGGIIA